MKKIRGLAAVPASPIVHSDLQMAGSPSPAQRITGEDLVVRRVQAVWRNLGIRGCPWCAILIRFFMVSQILVSRVVASLARQIPCGSGRGSSSSSSLLISRILKSALQMDRMSLVLRGGCLLGMQTVRSLRGRRWERWESMLPSSFILCFMSFANPFSILEMFRQDFGQGAGGPGGPGGDGFRVMTGPNPLAILSTLLTHGRHEDAVYSQDELERVITQLFEQNASGNAPPPASQNAIQSLPKKKVDQEMLGSEGKAECSICMDTVELGTEVTVLPCKHWFHYGCIEVWLNQHNTCPHCRRSIDAQ